MAFSLNGRLEPALPLSVDQVFFCSLIVLFQVLSPTDFPRLLALDPRGDFEETLEVGVAHDLSLVTHPGLCISSLLRDSARRLSSRGYAPSFRLTFVLASC